MYSVAGTITYDSDELVPDEMSLLDTIYQIKLLAIRDYGDGQECPALGPSNQCDEVVKLGERAY